MSWNAVIGAGGYSVRIGDAEVTDGALGSGVRSFDLADLGLDVGSHDVTVVAVHSTNPSLNSAPSNAVTFTVATQQPQPDPTPQQLSAPQITLAGSVVSWNAVAGAGGYSVRIAGAEVTGGTPGSGVRSFDLADLGLGDGGHVVTVVAVHPSDPSLNSLPSNAVTFTVTTGQPEPTPQQTI